MHAGLGRIDTNPLVASVIILGQPCVSLNGLVNATHKYMKEIKEAKSATMYIFRKNIFSF